MADRYDILPYLSARHTSSSLNRSSDVQWIVAAFLSIPDKLSWVNISGCRQKKYVFAETMGIVTKVHPIKIHRKACARTHHSIAVTVMEPDATPQPEPQHLAVAEEQDSDVNPRAQPCDPAQIDLTCFFCRSPTCVRQLYASFLVDTNIVPACQWCHARHAAYVDEEFVRPAICINIQTCPEGSHDTSFVMACTKCCEPLGCGPCMSDWRKWQKLKCLKCRPGTSDGAPPKKRRRRPDETDPESDQKRRRREKTETDPVEP